MKKSLLTLLVLSLVFCALLMSCKQDVNAPAADELVAVTFEEAGQSRGLTATLESFDVKDFYWTYTASKTVDPTTGAMLDGSGLKSGETSVEAYVQKGQKGLKKEGVPVKVPGFSQGLWDFTLYAYKNYDSTQGTVSDLVFKGSVSGVLLQKNGLNEVSVVVSPIEDGTGIIHIGEITLKAVSSASQSLVSSTVSILNTDETPATYTYDAENKNFTIKAGTYKVKVVFSNVADSSTITYAEGYVIATVYSGLKTTIAGDLSELVTYAQFDAELNPDIISNATVSSGEVRTASTDDITFTGADKVTATLSKTNAIALAEKLAENLGADDKTTADANLSVTVNTTAADATSITYDISMAAAVTYSKGGTSTTTTTQVTDAINPVTVEIDVQRGLTGITVTHGSDTMTKVDSIADLADQKFYYDDVNGKIYICTKSFSPFSLSYTVPEYVAEFNGQKFASLEAAFAAAEKSTVDQPLKIKLLKNTTVQNTIEVKRHSFYPVTNQLHTTHDYELDLNGCSISSGTRVFWIYNGGKLSITGKGEITSNAGGDSSVIRVGRGSDSVAKDNNSSSVEIGADVVIRAGKDTYGITLFGASGSDAPSGGAVKSAKIYGKIYSDLSAVSGNGNAGWGNTYVTIEDGAVLEAKSMSGIYHPQKGTLYINAASISGTTGIEMKAGNATVNVNRDAKITATSTEVSSKENNNGNSTKGYAVAVVENKNYAGSASLSIQAGTFRGPVEIVSDTVVSETAKASIRITAGKFSDDPSAYVVDGYGVVYRDGMYEVLPGVCKIGETWYPSIKAAVAAAGNGETPTTIVLQGSAKGPGVKIIASAPKNIIIDLNGYTYTIGSAVGSTGTETQAWHLEKGSKVTFKNGTLDVDPETTPNNFWMLLQNYCDLTLDNVVLDGSKLNAPGAYTSSNNNGKVVYKNGTKIIGKDSCYAFDVCWGPNKGYPAGTQVSIDDSCEVVGKIEIGTWGETDPAADVLSTLTVVSKKFDSQLVCGNKAYQISYDGNTRKLVPASN